MDLKQSDRQEKAARTLSRTVGQDTKSFVKLGVILKVMAQHLKQGDNVVEWAEIHSE